MQALSKYGLPVALVLLSLLAGGCTIHHSRQALDANSATPSDGATFVSEEDSGLGLLLGIFLISEPDHYSVLLARMERHYRCAKLHHAQLDFHTDHWLLVTFPIARITAICEPEPKESESASPPSPPSGAPPTAPGPASAPDAVSQTEVAPTATAAPVSPTGSKAADR